MISVAIIGTTTNFCFCCLASRIIPQKIIHADSSSSTSDTMLCTVLLNDRFSSSLGYIPSWTTILSSFIESITTNTARIVPIGNHISVFIPASQIKQKAKFMEISPGMDLSPSMIARQLRDMADRFEYQYIEEEKCSICASLPFLSQSQLRNSSLPIFIAFTAKNFVNALLKRIFEKFYIWKK
ncbi:ATP-dependent RNA helicase [Dirofilaria immitis]